MSSRSGPRATGTDGTDFQYRQRVAAQYQNSVTYKLNLKLIFVLHFFVLIFMWAKVGSEILMRDFAWENAFFKRLDLPSAYPWEYVWCFSVIPVFIGLASFPRNKVALINYHYYAQFFLGILPCAIGLGSQFPEFFDYIANPEGSDTPTFKGSFPMVIIWYIFFAIALQLHIFAMYCSYQLSAAWTPVKRD